jgi:hypothetical protein
MEIKSNVVLEATDLTYMGNGNSRRVLTVKSNNDATLAGTFTVDGPGEFKLDGGSATGVSAWVVRNGSIVLNNTGGNALGDTATVDLHQGGGLTGDDNETLGTVTVHTFGQLGGDMTMASLDRVSESVVKLGSNGPTLATNPYGTGTQGWIITGDSKFGAIDASGEITVAATTDSADLSTWTDPGTNYRMIEGETGVTGIIPAGTINAMGFRPKSRGTYTVTLAGALTVNSGGVTVGREKPNVKIHITGGSLTSGADALYLTQNARGGVELQVQSSIFGDIDVVLGGDGSVNLAGDASNTYTGTTYVGGVANLAKTGDAVAIPGDVEIMMYGLLTSEDGNQIADDASVVVNGTFEAGGETIGAVSGSGAVTQDLTVSGGSIAPGNSIGTLTLSGNLTAEAGTTLDFELGALSENDMLVFLNKTLNLNNNMLNVIDAGGLQEGQYILMEFYDDDDLLSDGKKPTSGLTLNMPSGFAGSSLDYSQTGLITLNVVPEPTTMAVLGLGIIGLIKRRR